MFTGLSTVATRRVPPRLGWPCAQAGRCTPGPTSEPTPAPAARPPTLLSHSRRVLPVLSLIAGSSCLSWGGERAPLLPQAPPPHCLLASLVVPASHSALHDQAHLAERLDVRERVALHRDEIRALARREGADLAVHPAGPGAAPRPRHQGA